ncbi:hypothetical protein V6N13_064187 [Hibiscus sabdariffa]|uniref:Uncharacterized protein n=2 Tax=Hibiscus sabdariffa TaxID=183260 RepID=A0ABR1ZR95_9ROSI
MKGIHSILVTCFLVSAFACFLASAFDPSPLQDFCVAINHPKDGVFENGKFCKDPKLAVADDFFFSGLNKLGNTYNRVGSNYNLGNTAAVAFVGLSSQNAGVITIANAVFGSNPPINPDVLTNAFQLDKNIVTDLQSIF